MGLRALPAAGQHLETAQTCAQGLPLSHHWMDFDWDLGEIPGPVFSPKGTVSEFEGT